MELIKYYIMLMLSYKKLKQLFHSLFLAFLFAFFFHTLVYQPFKIPSSSMKPGLQIGDYLFVEKFSYGYNNSSLSFMLNKFDLFSQSFFFKAPQRGDVVVFLLPSDTSKHYIKRIIGLPGDIIQVKDKQLYINNIPIRKEKQGHGVKIIQHGVYSIQNTFKETLPNGVHYLIHMNDGEAKYQHRFDPNNTIIYRVPSGHYFCMGDNRDNSTDSRFKNVGYVSKNKILGKAKVLFFTSDFSLLEFLTKLKMNRVFNIIK